MFSLMQKGGPIMYIIFALSIAAVLIIVERFLYFRRIKVDENSFMRNLKNALEKNYFNEALSICENTPTPIASIMKAGILNRKGNESNIRESIENAAKQEIPKLERYLPALGTIANISPLLGLLGTVTGNIRAFGILGSQLAVGDPSLLAGGISEALLTTAAGLIVSIPAVIFYNYLSNKVNGMIIRIENQVSEVVLILKGDRA